MSTDKYLICAGRGAPDPVHWIVCTFRYSYLTSFTKPV
jgi:hypothetical protein